MNSWWRGAFGGSDDSGQLDHDGGSGRAAKLTYVVTIPEPLKLSWRPPPLLHRVPDHDAERGSHDPAGYTGSSRKVREEESDNATE